MIRHREQFVLFLLVVACVIGCNRMPGGSGGQAASSQSHPGTGGSGEKQWEASGLFSDPKVIAMAEALQRTDLAKAEEILREGCDINATGKDGDITLPLWTMLVKNKTSFKWLFDHGANPNALPKKGDDGVLFLAAEAEDPEWLRVLLLHKAQPNLKCWSGVMTKTPLSEAISEYRKENLEMLIKAGADINYVAPKEEGAPTPAIYAAGYGWNEGVYMLLKAGADYQAPTGHMDVTYLVMERSVQAGSEAAEWRDKVLQLLKERGADLEATRKRVEAAKEEDRRERPWTQGKGQ